MQRKSFHEGNEWREGERTGRSGLDAQEPGSSLDAAQKEVARLTTVVSGLQGLLRSMRDVVLVFDADGRYVDIPSTAGDLLYRPGPDLIGKRMHDVMPQELADRFLGAIRHALAARAPVRLEYDLEIDSRRIWFSAVISPLEEDRVVWVARDTTAQRKAEMALRRSEERYRLLFEVNPMPMWVFDESTLRFLAVNEAAVRQYGYGADEFLTMTIADIRPAEDVPRLLEAVATMRGELTRFPGWRHRRKDGTLIDVDIVQHVIEFDGRPAALVLADNVTEKRRAEAELRETGEVLRAVVDDAPMAIVSADLALKITRWNPAAERLFGWSAAEMLERPYLSIVPEDRREEHRAARETALHGPGVSTYETRRCRKDGSQVDVTVSLGALHGAGGSVQGFVAMMADITERRRLEERLLRSQKLEAVGQLAGGIAHDFNNLLTAITSYSQLILDDMPVQDERRGDVLEIRRAADRAGSLTRQLLTFSRQQVVQTRTVSLNAIVIDIEKMLRRLVREDIDLSISLDPTGSLVEADPGQLEQVLVNLVVNARDAIPAGGRILIETSRAEQETGSRVELSVSDTGTGMSEDVQRHIFEPFFTTKEPGRGTGLGLATVYGIVEQAGGEIRVYSEVGTGTRFSILLPRVTGRVAETPAQPASSATEARGGQEVVLVVEDDNAVRDVARRVLVRQGYNVLEARTGAEGLSIVSSRDGAIDLVVTDMVMPEMSGAELAARLRSDFPELRILFMSGYSRDATRQLLPFDRHSAYLEKPFSPGRLTHLVRELLDA